jgi:hypothetical protein
MHAHAQHLLLPALLAGLPDKTACCCLLQALKRDFAPLEGFDASKIPYPAHHLPGATLKGFPMKPWALLNSRWVLPLLWWWGCCGGDAGWTGGGGGAAGTHLQGKGS